MSSGRFTGRRRVHPEGSQRAAALRKRPLRVARASKALYRITLQLSRPVIPSVSEESRGPGGTMFRDRGYQHSPRTAQPRDPSLNARDDVPVGWFPGRTQTCEFCWSRTRENSVPRRILPGSMAVQKPQPGNAGLKPSPTFAARSRMSSSSSSFCFSSASMSRDMINAFVMASRFTVSSSGMAMLPGR